MSDAMKIAIAGLGTIGGGTLELLVRNADVLAQRAGRELRVVAVADPHRDKDLPVSTEGMAWYDDAAELIEDADVDVVVELIGGAEGIAKTVCERAIARGIHVVTANKALLAHHGTALGRAAEEAGVTLAYEAAVGGGIPIIKAMREGLAANRISRVYGILNGTCNYVLTEMRESGREFSEVLTEAQMLGYAEANPSFDVDGIDTAHKLAVLTSVAFGTEIDFYAMHVEGIRHITPMDIRFAQELGYRLKLLGIAELTDGGVSQRVHPCLVPLSATIAQVDGVFNAVLADGDFVDTVMFEGRGAGAHPTASAVVADIVDIARERRVPTFAVPATRLRPHVSVPMSAHVGSYYVRLMVQDRPGVFAEVAAVLRDHDVSIEAVIQRARAPGETVPVVLTLHETREENMLAALEIIGGMEAVAEEPRMIRIEPL